MTARTHITLAIGLFLPATALAEPPQTAAEAVTQVEAKYADVTTMNAHFVQTVKNPMFGDDVQSGVVTLSRPTKMHWSFGEGERLFVTNGSTMWIYTKSNNQVIQYNGFTPAAGGAESLLSSLDTLDELYNVALVSSAPTVMTLTPKGDSKQFKSVTLTLDSDLVVDDILIVDAFDNTTEIDFTGMTLNGAAPDSLFSFTPPAGATVVDAGSM